MTTDPRLSTTEELILRREELAHLHVLIRFWGERGESETLQGVLRKQTAIIQTAQDEITTAIHRYLTADDKVAEFKARSVRVDKRLTELRSANKIEQIKQRLAKLVAAVGLDKARELLTERGII